MTQVKVAQKENPGTTLEVNYCVPWGLLRRLCERDCGVSFLTPQLGLKDTSWGMFTFPPKQKASESS